MLGAIQLLLVDARVRHHGGRVKHAELNACGDQADQRGIESAFGQVALLHGIDVSLLNGLAKARGERHALVVHASNHRDGRTLCLGGPIAMIRCDIAHGVAVRNDIALEAPLAPQLVLQKVLVGARRLAVDGVVGAHHRGSLALDNGRAKGRLVGVDLVVPAHVDIGKVTGRLRAAVHGEVFGGGNTQVVLGVVALQARYIGHAHATGQEGILAVGLLPTAPAWIAKDVQVGRPKVEPTHDTDVALAQVLHMLDATFHTDLCGHGVDACGVKGRGQAHRLWVLGYALVDHAVESLAPPLVGRNVETRHCGGVVLHLRCLFGERHAMHQVRGAFLRGKLRIHKRHMRRVLLRASRHERCRAQGGDRESQFQTIGHGILQGVTGH